MPTSPFSADLKQRSLSLPRVVREHEILRISGTFASSTLSDSVNNARRAALSWCAKKTTEHLPASAWRLETFEHMAAGRSCSAVRFKVGHEDIWAIRSEDPDKNVPDRVWTTELTFAETEVLGSRHIRLLASSREVRPETDPATPVIARQLIERLTLKAGVSRLTTSARWIADEAQANELLNALSDPQRELPILVLSTSEWQENPMLPLADAELLARNVAGLCEVHVLPAAQTWVLTRQLGRTLSVFEGACRIYWPGFTEDANPFTHDLILPAKLTGENAAVALRRLKWSLAEYSVRRSPATRQVKPFIALKSQQATVAQDSLAENGAPDRDQLEAARAQIAALKEQLDSADKDNIWLSAEHDEAETRAKEAEELAAVRGFQIQQLTTRLREAGRLSDEQTQLPRDWTSFEEWCDREFVGRLILTSQARRGLSAPFYESPETAARCLLWLANDYRERRLEGGLGSIRELTVLEGVRNTHCGTDSYVMNWKGESRDVIWYIKNGGNTRDPLRCLRIYHFWDDSTDQVVVADMPAHRHSEAS